MERIKQALDRARQERESGNKHTDPSARSPAPAPAADDIQYTQTRVVTVSPQVLARNRVVAGMGPGPVRDAYGMLRTRVLQHVRHNGWKAIAVSSATVGEGKTLTSVNLAVSLAREVNYTVLLVDFDLRRPTVHTYFGYQPEKGLADYVLSDTPIGQVLFNPSLERLVVLPNAHPMENSSEILSSPKVVELVDELKNRYPERLVIFDLPPLLSSDDALAFSPYVDAVLLVAEDGRTQRADLARAHEILESTGTPLLGTVLNKTDERMAAEYY